MAKAPAFQFYPKQFLGDDMVLLMSTESIGAHILLMCIAWQQDPPCSLPDDVEKIRKWTKLGIKSWNKRGKEILSAWRLEDGRWYQDGLLKEHKKQIELRTKRESAANKRWNTPDANALQVQSTSNALHSSSSSSTSLKNKHIRRVFKIPELKEVTDYCQERKNNIDPQAWLDHYTSNGWMVGKVAMKDWKAAIRTWERRNYGGQQGKPAGGVGIPKEYKGDVPVEKVDDARAKLFLAELKARAGADTS